MVGYHLPILAHPGDTTRPFVSARQEIEHSIERGGINGCHDEEICVGNTMPSAWLGTRERPPGRRLEPGLDGDGACHQALSENTRWVEGPASVRNVSRLSRESAAHPAVGV